MIFDATLDTAYVNQFYGVIQIHSGETSRPCDFAHSVTVRPHRSLLRSPLQNYMRGRLVASLPFTLHGTTNNT